MRARSPGIKYRQESDVLPTSTELSRHFKGNDAAHRIPPKQIRAMRLYGANRLKVLQCQCLNRRINCGWIFHAWRFNSVKWLIRSQMSRQVVIPKDPTASAVDAEKRRLRPFRLNTYETRVRRMLGLP